MAQDGVQITPKQLKAIDALLTSRTVSDAALAAGVALRTLQRWIGEDDTFQAALTAAQDQVIDAAGRRLLALQDTAIDTLSAVLLAEDTPAGVKVRAAELALMHLDKLRTRRDKAKAGQTDAGGDDWLEDINWLEHVHIKRSGCVAEQAEDDAR